MLLDLFRYWQETTTYKNEVYLFPQALLIISAVEDVGRAWIGRPPRACTLVAEHGDVAEETIAVDNSVEPWSQSVERVDMAVCESISSVFAFDNGDTRDQLRLAKGAIFPVFERFLPIPEFSRFCGMKKFKNSPLG